MTEKNGLLLQMIVNGPFQENCFLVADMETRQAIMVDPGFSPDELAAAARDQDLTVTEIVCTHAHIDHAGAVAPLKRLLGATFALHPEDKQVLEFMPGAAQMYGLPPVEVPEVDRELADGDEIKVGELSGQVIHTPGHSPGGCCLYFKDQGVLIAGDTLFSGSVGRTDLPGGSTETLLRSIKERLLCLPDETEVHCGHGPATTIGAERKANPFLQPGGMNFF